MNTSGQAALTSGLRTLGGGLDEKRMGELVMRMGLEDANGIWLGLCGVICASGKYSDESGINNFSAPLLSERISK